jgi:hypothetical protein
VWRQFGRHLSRHPVPTLELRDGAPVLVGNVGHRESDVAECGDGCRLRASEPVRASVLEQLVPDSEASEYRLRLSQR